jgi:hypothetical protein
MWEMKYFGLFVGSLIVSLMGNHNIIGQTDRQCDTGKVDRKNAKYVIVSTERVPGTSQLPETILIYVFVENRYINSEKLIIIGSLIKQRFCDKNRIVAMLFDNRKRAMHFDPDFKESRDALRGTYVFDQQSGEEYISYVSGTDYFGNPDKRIKIKLN